MPLDNSQNLRNLTSMSSRPNGYSEARDFKLPNSKLTVGYSIRYYKFQDTDSPAVMPDKLIEPDWKSYKSGHDPVLEWILAQPVK